MVFARNDDHAVIIIIQVGIVLGNEIQALGRIDPLMHGADHAHDRHFEHLGGIGDRFRYLRRSALPCHRAIRAA